MVNYWFYLLDKKCYLPSFSIAYALASLVKLHYFQFAYLENCIYKNKRNHKRSKEFLFKQKSVRQLCERSFLDMMFALLLRTEWYNFLHSPGWRSSWNWRMFIFDNYNGVQFITIIWILFPLNHQSVNLLW